VSAVSPSVIALAGPNGAGKSTAGPKLLKETLGVTEFVNADVIAQGLSGFSPESMAFAAGRIMLGRLKQLAHHRRTFAFETTLSGRAHARWLARLLAEGYQFHLTYLWLASPELALARVADRVRQGGHNVPRATVERRYHAGLRNFFHLYRTMATNWRLYDNSAGRFPRLVAIGHGSAVTEVEDASTWAGIVRSVEVVDGP